MSETELDKNKEEISNFLDAIQQKNYNQAEKHFSDILGDRVSDALDQTKIKLASQIYQGEDEIDDESTDETEEDLSLENSDEEELVDDEEFEDEEFVDDEEFEDEEDV